MKLAPLIYLLFLWTGPCMQDVQAQLPFPADSSEVSVRTADADRLQELTDEKVFQYQEVAQNPETFLDRLRRWLFSVLMDVLQHPWASVIIKVIFFAIFGIVLAALINQLIGGHFSSAFTAKKPEDAFDLNMRSRSLFDRSYDTMLSEALDKRHYKDAVRILYIMALKDLSEKEMIVWKPDKTNHDYLAELADHPSRKSFDQLTTFYEYIEYGDFQIQEAGYEKVYTIFQDFRQKAGNA